MTLAAIALVAIALDHELAVTWMTASWTDGGVQRRAHGG